MKMIVRRSFATALAGALMALSTGSVAQGSSAVKLSDAELDQITAGSGAISQVIVFNPGNAEVQNTAFFPGTVLPRHATCINVCLPPNVIDPPRTSGAVLVVLPNGKPPVFHFIRQPFSPQ